MFNSIRADTIAQLKNGYRRKLQFIQIRYSKEMINLLNVLKEAGYIEGYNLLELGNKQAIGVNLRYVKNRPAIREIKILSKPGQKLYVKKDKIPVIYNGFGSVILSTNQGIMTSQQAHQKGIGGELLATVF